MPIDDAIGAYAKTRGHGPDRHAVAGGLLDSSDYMGREIDAASHLMASSPRVTHGATGAERFEAAASHYPTGHRSGAPRPLEVAPGIAVSSLCTVAECDKARTELSAAIVCIEGQIDAAEERSKAGGPGVDLDWHRRARGALRAKRAALTEVEFMRGTLAHAEKQSAAQSSDAAQLDILAALHPTIFAEVQEEARKRGILH